MLLKPIQKTGDFSDRMIEVHPRGRIALHEAKLEFHHAMA